MKKKLNLKLLFLVAVCFAFTNIANAQISGTITDDSGEPLIGATIRIEGTTQGAISDIDGSYSLPDGPSSGTITASYVGYGSKSEEIDGRSTIDFVLSGDNSILDEVVVVGYGVQNREEITGAVAQVKAEDFNQGNIADASALIQGKVAGVSISRPGGDPNSAPNIRLRGISTFGGATSPLILVDGVAVNSLEEIDPNDIESMNVLKDAASSAIYGARGSNGVILVTTKSGTFTKTPKISYNGQLSFESVNKTAEVADASRYLSMPNAVDYGSSVDYIDEISQTGVSTVQNLSIDGGNEITTYRISGTYRDVEGTLRNSGFNQFNLRGNLNHTAMEGKLRMNGNLVMARSHRDYSFPEAFRYAATINPTIPIYDATNTANAGYNEIDLFDYYNPVAMVEQNTNQNDNNNYKGALQFDYDLMEDLTATVSYAMNVNTGQNYQYYPKEARFRGQGRNGLADRSTFNTERQTVQTYLNYKRDELFTNVNFDGLLGYTYEQIDRDGFNSSNGDLVSNDASYNQLGSGSDLQAGLAGLGSYNNRQQLRGYFGRLNFGIAQYYNLNTNLRYEGNNAFGENEQYGFFYGIGGSADIAGITDSGKFDFLKFRASYGSTGNLPGGAYLYTGPYVQSGYYPDGSGGFAPSLALSRDPNPNLKWEEKSEFNLGFDFETTGAIFGGAIDYFNTTSNDLILFLSGDTDRFPLTGQGFANVGSISSSGLELLVNYNGIDRESFSWKPTLTSTFYFSNKLKKLDRPSERIANAGAPGNNSTNMILLEEGGSFGQIYGATYEGVDANGEPIFTDTNGDGSYVPLDDNTVIGSGVPDIEVGFNNQFNFGNWDASVFFRGAFGHQLVNLYRFFYENSATSSYNRVVTDNYNEALSVTPNSTISTRVVENANFVKIDNVVLGYTFPMNSKYVDGLRLFGNSQGLATITGYSGIDPEVRWVDTGSVDNGGYATSDNRAPGIDRRTTYARPMTFTFGAGFTLK